MANKGRRTGILNEYGLNGREEMFCRLYIRDFKGSPAAREAGYTGTPKSIDNMACALLARDEIRAYIQVLKNERVERMKIDADYVLNRLIEIDNMDVMDILNDDMTIKPVPEWPKSWRRYLAGFKLEELISGRGDQKELLGMLKNIKWPDKVKNLELIGKHIGVGAWKENATVNVKAHIETKSLADIFKDMSGDNSDDGDDD